MDALGRRAVPIDPGSFSHRPLSSPCISALLPLTSLLPLVAAGAGAEARVLERTWTVPLASKGRLDAVVFWWEAGVLLPQSKGGINDDDDDMRVLISCAPPPALLAEGCRAGALPLVPLEELHRWQMAWLDFARFEVG